MFPLQLLSVLIKSFFVVLFTVCSIILFLALQFFRSWGLLHKIHFNILDLGGCYTVICHCLPVSLPTVSGFQNNQAHAL